MARRGERGDNRRPGSCLAMLDACERVAPLCLGFPVVSPSRSVCGGGTIENKAKGLPVAKVRIASVRPLSFFRTESRLLGLQLVFDHWIEPTPTATRIKTRMNFGGPLAPILRLVRGRAIALSTRESLQKLADLAVAEGGKDSSPL